MGPLSVPNHYSAMDTDIPIDQIVLGLREKPLAEQLELLLLAYNNGAPSQKDQLEVVITLLKYTVPDVYRHLTAPTQEMVATAFRSTVGLGNLLSRIDMLLRLKADLLLDVLLAVNCHTRLLEKVLLLGLLRNLLVGRPQLEQKEVDRLLFKGKCYAVLREADYRLTGVYVPTVCRDLSAYAAFLCHELLSVHGECDAKLINTLVHSLQGVNQDTTFQFFDTMFSPGNIDFLRRCVLEMKRFERKSSLLKFLQFVQNAYLRGDKPDLVPALYTLTNYCFDHAVWDSVMMESIIGRSSYALNTLSAYLARAGLDDANYVSLVYKTLQVWGNSIHMKGEPIVTQGFRTHLLVSLCALVPQKTLQDLLGQKPFIDAITTRLQAVSDRVRSLGVYFADKVCEFADHDRIFNMGSSALGVAFPEIATHLPTLELEQAWEQLDAPTIEPPAPDVDELEQVFKLSLRNETANDDAQMSDEEDDPTLSTAQKVQLPLYIRDVLNYLLTDTKAPQAYEMIQIALKSAPTLIRQKKGFGDEVAFYAEDLLSKLAGMTNFFEDAEFETLKLNAMIAVVVSYPPVTTHLCQLLLTGDYSLQQRVCLLSTLSLAARELRGYKDEAVSLSHKAQNFPSQMLPEGLHQQYLAAEGKQIEDYGNLAIQAQIQNQLMGDASEEAKDELAGGRILRVSASLKKKPENHSGPLIPKDALNQFNKSVGRTFFFPLVNLWWESGGINIGAYTPVLIAHYLKTLSLILHAAYPSASDLLEMSREYLALLVLIIPVLDAEQLPVVESLCTGALLVMDVVDDSFLITEMLNDLSKIQAFLSTIWESIIDEKVKSICAGLLLRLNELHEKYERTIMDQMNRGFI